MTAFCRCGHAKQEHFDHGTEGAPCFIRGCSCGDFRADVAEGVDKASIQTQTAATTSSTPIAAPRASDGAQASLPATKPKVQGWAVLCSSGSTPGFMGHLYETRDAAIKANRAFDPHVIAIYVASEAAR